MLTVDWKGGFVFEGHPSSGNSFMMDATEGHGGQNCGPSPLEAFLCSAAGCSAMDVVSILEKKRQHIESYRVEVEWTRAPEGDWPRPILSINLRHVLKGADLDQEAVQRAVELSDEKYCTVIATLRHCPTVHSEYRIDV